jgi:ABC-2 type transport system ATP-binding protein
MSEAETKRKFEAITDFAALRPTSSTRPWATTPRACTPGLGFAIAIHVDADIFLADEALAVGDKPFKVKCMKKLKEIRESGVTIFYVSHAAGSVRNICSRVLVLEKGVLGFDGDVEAGIKYVKYDDDTEGTDDQLGSEV